MPKEKNGPKIIKIKADNKEFEISIVVINDPKIGIGILIFFEINNVRCTERIMAKEKETPEDLLNKFDRKAAIKLVKELITNKPMNINSDQIT